jgi:hypothetical protein
MLHKPPSTPKKNNVPPPSLQDLETKMKALVFRFPNYQYLSVCVYQMMKLEGGGLAGCCVCVTLEQVYSVYTTV